MSEGISNESKFEMVLHSAAGLPGVKIDRERFLTKELSKHFDDDVVKKAISTNPAQAGISVKNLEQIAKDCIAFEATKVTALSTAAGLPGGFAMFGTVPADLAQYFGHILRILQKLLYLYGWQELFQDTDGDTLNDGLTHQLTLFVGVMFGVDIASAAIAKIAQAAAKKIPKALMQKALTKGAIYPIVKKIAATIGVKMTKEVFAKSIGKVIPVLGAVVSGGLAIATFLPMANRLKKYLVTLPMASVDFYRKKKEKQEDVTIVDVDFSDIEV